MTTDTDKRGSDIVERLRKETDRLTGGLARHIDGFDAIWIKQAADEIDNLRSELEAARERNNLANYRADNLHADLEKFKSEREYIVGCNDGWDEAMLQARELIWGYWHGDKPHMRQWDEACSTIADEIEKLVSPRALASESNGGRG